MYTRPFLVLIFLSLINFSSPVFSAEPVNQELLPAMIIQTKIPGNPAVSYPVRLSADLTTQSNCNQIDLKVATKYIDADKTVYTFILKAKKDVNFHLNVNFKLQDMPHADLDFLLPGLWYKRNMKVSTGAPSMSVSNTWMFREDRLSTPMVAAYNPVNKKYFSLKHSDAIKQESLIPYNSGEVIMYGESDMGSVGFGDDKKQAYLACTYPVAEYPKSYTRKLLLNKPITVFHKLKKGEVVTLNYEVTKGEADTYTDFMRQMWQYAYDSSMPQPVETTYSGDQVKKFLSGYYKESFTDEFPLKGYSGVHVNIDKCEKRGIIEVGFIGRIFLNAFYAMQYGEATGDRKLVDDAKAIFDSYLKNGFTKNGFLREKVDFVKNVELPELSIRRQSEGMMALFYYLSYEKSKGRSHPEWEVRIKQLLDKTMALQRADFSFPRKFSDKMDILDDTGGSSSCVVLPLTMAYKYFNDPKYLAVAEKTAIYMKKESIDKGDYFSSTLDARCEDKEASIYITTAYYYLWLSTHKKEYIDYAAQSVYFSLSYYYTWDVPFAQGQMLGDLGLKTRGWGNVSVENNHIDVYIFEFIDVMNWLSKQTGDKRMEAFGKVIASSLQDQLLPVEGRLCGIAKPGYYPEVVQHTNWDYGNNGKGFYNALFGPGWVVASLWTMLSPGNTDAFFSTNLVSK